MPGSLSTRVYLLQTKKCTSSRIYVVVGSAACVHRLVDWHVFFVFAEGGCCCRWAIDGSSGNKQSREWWFLFPALNNNITSSRRSVVVVRPRLCCGRTFWLTRRPSFDVAIINCFLNIHQVALVFHRHWACLQLCCFLRFHNKPSLLFVRIDESRSVRAITNNTKHLFVTIRILCVVACVDSFLLGIHLFSFFLSPLVGSVYFTVGRKFSLNVSHFWCVVCVCVNNKK